MDRGRLGSLIGAAALILSLSGWGLTATAGGSGAGQPHLQRVSAQFVDLDLSTGDNCGHAIGIEFGSVRGAVAYTTSYWDGYYRAQEVGTATVAQLKAYKAPYVRFITGSVNFWPVTGGFGSPPCQAFHADPTEGGRFSRGVKVWAVFPAGYKPPLADGIDWRTSPRLTGPPTGSYGLPTTNEIFPASWRANVFLTNGGESATCDASVRWLWKVTPPSGARLIGGQPKPGCSFTLEGSRLGSYGVRATAERRKQGKWVPAGRTLNRDVELKDVVIVALGDSNGSGEGNPPFYYPRCDRSVAAYQFESAVYLETQDPRSSVTLLHASCSGARIDHLVRTPYEGTHAFTPPLRPQIKQVSIDLGVRHPARTVSAVIVSAGVNDLAFGPLISFCVTQAPLHPNTPCPELHVTPTFDSSHRVNGFTVSGNSAPTLRDELAALQTQLLPRYNELAVALTRPLDSGGLGVKAGHVLITQYPDFTNGDNGQPCGPTGYARFDTSTWTWLALAAAQLNRTVAAAASRHHWTLVPASALFATRGYCASNSAFVGIGESGAAFDIAGAFHPNGMGHTIEAEQVEPRLCRLLGLSDTCKSKP